MTFEKIWLYSEDDVTPKVVETVRGIIADRFPGRDIRFAQYVPGDHQYTDVVLVLGKVTDKGAIPETVRVEYTYSIPQLMTKANAATVFESAVRRVLRQEEKPDLTINKYYVNQHVDIDNWKKWDFTKPVAIDIETSGNLGKTHTPEEVGLLSVAVYQPGAGCVVYLSNDSFYNDQPGTVPFSAEQVVHMGKFLDKFEKPIYHNGKFDIRVLNRVCGVNLHNFFDTMLAHHVLNQAAGTHGLKELARLYFGADDWEVGLGKYLKGGGHYERIPYRELAIYNGWDVYWTYRLYELLDPQIDADENAQKAFMLEMAAAEFLLKVERRGIPFDIEYAEALSGKLQAQAEVARQAMCTMLDNEKFNPGSWQQVKRALSDYGIETTSTDEKHIKAIQESAPEDSALYKFCSYLISYRKATKMKGTYSEGWARVSRKGLVHPTFLVHGTSTGRLSSSNPNAQNVPRDKKIRKMVTLTHGNAQ